MQVIAICRNKAQIKDERLFVVEYKNADIVLAYNQLILKKSGDVLIFCEDYTIDANTVNYCLDLFAAYGNLLSCIYGDFYPLQSINKLEDPQYRIPFLFNRAFFEKNLFNPHVNNPNYEFLKQLAQSSLVYHLPKRLFNA